MRKTLWLLATTLLSTAAFANLPYVPVELPRDDAAHYENTPYPVTNMTEWWYYNGHVVTTDGHEFGYYVAFSYGQLDFHGTKVRTPTVLLQISDIDKQQVYGKIVFPLQKHTVMATDRLNLELGRDNTLTKNGETYLVNAAVPLKNGGKLALSLSLTPRRGLLLINLNGLIDADDKTNSYYYSQTHLETAGTLSIGKETFVIDTAKSLSWMDHQWGDFLLNMQIAQWTWSSVQLENGLEINFADVMDAKTKQSVRKEVSYLLPDGSTHFTRNITVTPTIDPAHKHPLLYTVSIPELHLEMTEKAMVPDQDVTGVAEGVSMVEGIYEGQAVKGFGFVESTIEP